MAKIKFKSFLLLSISTAILLTNGCVERKLTINTSPQGGLVYLNDEQIGQSPVTVEFNWYGDYKVRIEKDGFQTLDTHREIPRPWHDKFPMDFFVEVFWPQMIVHQTDWQFELAPYQPPDRQQLIDTAKQMDSKMTEKSALSLQTDQD